VSNDVTGLDREQGYMSNPPYLYLPTVEVTRDGLPVVGMGIAPTCSWEGCEAFAYLNNAYRGGPYGRKGSGLCGSHKFRRGSIAPNMPLPPVYRFLPPSGEDPMLSMLTGVLVSPAPWYGMMQVKAHPTGQRMFLNPHFLELVKGEVYE
jgi:hypothetical protein